MKLGKRIIIANSLIIFLLSAVIVVAAAVAGATVVKNNIRNVLVDTVTARAAVISASNGVVPNDFDYTVGGVYLGVYLEDGSLKNGSFPGEIDLPIDKGVIRTVRLDGKRYYVYDFAVAAEGRDEFYLRGAAAEDYDFWHAAIVSVAVFAAVVAAAGIILNILSVRKAVMPIDRMRREVNEITETGDIKKRLSGSPEDSELNMLAEDYNYMLDSLEKMFRNHERFASDVAHELRTPLSVILSESEFALTEAKDEKEKDESLEAILRQSRRLRSITDSLLEFTRFVNKLGMELAPVDISAVTEEFIAEYKFGRGITCTADIDEGIVVPADVTLYERVLQNLIGNAVKYGKEGGKVFVSLKKPAALPSNTLNVGGAVTASETATENNTATGAVLTVSDDGVGMSEQAVAHAFDRFYREEASRSGNGLGLGLSFVKEIARLFGAKAEISSVKGEGTTVTFTFAESPAKTSSKSPAKESHAKSHAKTPHSKGKRG